MKYFHKKKEIIFLRLECEEEKENEFQVKRLNFQKKDTKCSSCCYILFSLNKNFMNVPDRNFMFTF